MNHIYRVVWSASLGMYQVASEVASGRGGKSRSVDRRRARKTALAAFAVASVSVGSALAAPANPVATMDGLTPLYAGYPDTGSLPAWQFDGTNLTISGTTFATITGALGTISNAGTLSGTYALSFSSTADVNRVENNGSINVTGNSSGSYNSGTIGTLVNRGTVTTGTFAGIGNGGLMLRLENDGTINGFAQGLNNSGTMLSVVNTGSIAASAGYGVLNTATLGTLNNSGRISGIFGVAAVNTGVPNPQIAALTNSGTIVGTEYGIVNRGSSITTIDNLAGGQIVGSSSDFGTGINNQGVTVSSSFVSGTIGTVNNAGTISGAYGISNTGTIGTINNFASGVITGTLAAITNEVEGAALFQINNAGTIAGDITHVGTQPLSIAGASNAAFGTLTGLGGAVGTLTSSESDVHFNGGNLLLNDGIELALVHTAFNDSSVLQVNRPIRIVGNYSQGANGTLQIGVAGGAATTGNIGTDSGYGRLVVTGATTIASGSTIALQSLGYNFAAGQRFVVLDTAGGATYNEGTLRYVVNGAAQLSGTGTSVFGGGHQSLVVTVTAPYVGAMDATTALVAGTPSGSGPNWSFDGTNLSVTGTSFATITGGVGTLTNSGTLTGAYALSTSAAGNIGLLENNGVIAATGSGSSGLYNGGTIGTLVNRGSVSTAVYGGVSNGGTLTRFENSGTITGASQGLNNSNVLTSALNSGTIRAGNGYGVLNSAQMGTLTNTGLISGDYAVVSTKSGSANPTLDMLINSGTIAGSTQGVVNANAYLGLLENQAGGQILALGGASVNVEAVVNGGTIGQVNNAGTISGGYYGFYNSNAIGTINNLAGGVITGLGGAISNQQPTSSIGQINNSGTIAGWIINRSPNNLYISGATDGTFGTLTGFGPTYSGTIVSTNADVHFNGGKLVIDDHFDLANTRTAYNDSSVVQVNNVLRVAGHYSQGADGTLQIGVANGALATGNFATDVGYGRLLVSGNTYIAPGSSIALQSLGYNFAAGQRYVVIDTAGAAIYNEGTLRYAVNGYPSLAASGAKVGNGSNTDLVVTIFAPADIGTIAGTTPLSPGVAVSGAPDWAYDGANLTITGTTFGSINGSLGSLTNNGTLTGTSALSIGTNGGSIGKVENNGQVHATGATDSAIYNGGVIGTLVNKNTLLSDNMAGVNSVTAITRLENSGQITGGRLGIANTGALTNLLNTGTITSTSTLSNGVGVWSTGQIGSIDNSGLITGYTGAMVVASGNPTPRSTLDTFTNSGSVVGTFAGLSNYGGTIGTINNLAGGRFTGTDAAYSSGIVNDWTSANATSYAGTIGAINNAGTLTAGYYGIFNAASIGTINNLAGGTITGLGGAISNQSATSSIGQINNAGTIAGWIINRSPNDLRIAGATDGTFGTITSFGPTYGGTIVSTNADVRFNGGNLVVGNNFDLAGTRTAYNEASVLQINKAIQVSGNYAQSAGATLQIGVASNAVTTGDTATDSGYGRLVVSGNTTLAAGSSVALQSLGYNFAAGQRYVVIDTAGTANYNASSLVYRVNGSTTLDASGAEVANGSHKNLVVTLANGTGANNGSGNGGINNGGNTGNTGNTGNAGGTGSNPEAGNGNNNGGLPAFDPRTNATIASASNAVSALRGLLGYTGVSDPQLLNLFNATLGTLSDRSADSANRVGKQLAPAQNLRAAGAATFGSMNLVNSHVNGLRVAQAGGTGVATGDSAANWDVWGQAFGGHSSQSAREDVDGYSANYGGLLVGADRAFGERVRAGGAFQFSRTVINNDGSTSGNQTSVNGYGLIGYAAYTGEPWYVNLTGSVVLQRYNSTRMVSMQGFSGAANGNFNGQQYVTSAEFGWPLALGRAIVTPLASLTYSYLNQSSYTETGGNGTALSVGSSGSSSVRSALGAKIAVPIETSSGTWTPELGLRWVHEYNRTRQSTGASFAADPTGQTGFTTVGATPVSDLAEMSLGVTLMRANNLSASIRYDLQVGSGFVSHTGIVRVQQRF
ncbi:hemagglutinin-related protein [Pandoraea captiosa]|uniref:Hemagglutinin-related protein n=1 Tax=Pandoraea captiosa TaxID=2508302 RepID=A0A5E5A708_9BURK|nr:autotransporter domain-containing protein [Pandoraea captiosa]VVE69461.1 hemagglutinin-related protein [Pandoraea captiosa]